MKKKYYYVVYDSKRDIFKSIEKKFKSREDAKKNFYLLLNTEYQNIALWEAVYDKGMNDYLKKRIILYCSGIRKKFF